MTKTKAKSTTASPDQTSVHRVEVDSIKSAGNAVLAAAGGKSHFRVSFPRLILQSIYEVLDPVRSQREALSELKVVEKDYLAIKIEILIRDRFEIGTTVGLILTGGQTDGGEGATCHGKWFTVSETAYQPCLVVQVNETKWTCSFGLLMASNEHQNLQESRPRRNAIPKPDSKRVHWLIEDMLMPGLKYMDTKQNVKKPSFAIRKRLPPDPEEMNDKRSRWAGEAMKAFEIHGELPDARSTLQERRALAEQNLSDLIADFGHYCDRLGLDMKRALQTGKCHYDEETDHKGTQFGF